MLNSMGATARVRMTPDDRRRQLVGIGLRKFVERPVQELSLDEVAAEAGVSRGLLFHYFPNKTDYHRAVVEAARRRVGRNVSPETGVVGEAAVRQVVERFLDQVARRRSRAPPATTPSRRCASTWRAWWWRRRTCRSPRSQPCTAGSRTSRTAPCSGPRCR